MNITTLLLIGLGLSMDAFTVSIANGIIIQNVKVRDALKIAIYFGVFQAVMPLIGWLAGLSFQKYITSYDHWIALILLGAIGINMIKESRESEQDDADGKRAQARDVLAHKKLIVMAIATSIDALAVGISFAVLSVSIMEAITVIGLLTFVVCYAGVYIGEKFGSMLKKHAELLGGVILVGIGLKIFIEHTDIIAKIFGMF